MTLMTRSGLELAIENLSDDTTYLDFIKIYQYPFRLVIEQRGDYGWRRFGVITVQSAATVARREAREAAMEAVRAKGEARAAKSAVAREKAKARKKEAAK